MKKRKVYMLALISLMLFLMGCSPSTDDKNDFVSESNFYLDTIVNIKIYNPTDKTEEIFDKVFNRIEVLEKTLSVHIKGSDLYHIKENAGIKPVKVSEETFFVIEKSIHYAEISQGCFDITTGPLIDLWNINPPEGHVPTQEELKDVSNIIDYKKIVLDKDNLTIFLEDKGMIANLGAIAKGYIADEVKKVLIENEVERAIINLGGNVLLVGDRSDGSDYSIGVQDPLSDRGAYLGLIKSKHNSLVSSGDYERYFIKDGKKYHHILNPFTGYPADNELMQVTIISHNSIDADALSTTTFLLGLDKGINLIEEMDNIEGVFITKDHKIYLTSGIQDKFVFDEEDYGQIYEVIKNTAD
ncbi:MAG: FAD:protein FMN transferase [Eubacteriales bacterium]